MSEKKRKRRPEGSHGIEQVNHGRSNDIIKVSLLESDGLQRPVIASSPGLTLPQTASFTPYNYEQTDPPSQSLFLHSDSHPTLDYTASEPSSPDLAHYIGIYDPARKRLKLVPARFITVRTSLKSSRPAPKGVGGTTGASKSSKAALGLAFGSKKSKKAIQAYQANAIAPSKALAEDKIASAVIESMPVQPATQKEDMQAEVDAARPIPRPNLAATRPEDVYTVESLVGGADVLARIPVKDWMDELAKPDGNVQVRSKFVSQKIATLCEKGDVKMVRVLRYTYMLIMWWKCLRPGKGPRSGKTTPRLERSPQPQTNEAVLAEFPKHVLADMEKRFSEGGTLSRWHDDRVIAHILALTLHIDGWESDTCGIQFDLKKDHKEVARYFAELGAKATAMMKREYERRGISRVEASMRRVARLSCPVSLPKLRTGGGGKRR